MPSDLWCYSFTRYFMLKIGCINFASKHSIYLFLLNVLQLANFSVWRKGEVQVHSNVMRDGYKKPTKEVLGFDFDCFRGTIVGF